MRRHVAPKQKKTSGKFQRENPWKFSNVFLCISLPLQDNNSIDILIYYPSLRPSASSGKRKICPSESPHVFYSPGYCKACDSLLDRLGILALKTQHADGCPCNIMQMCNMVSMYSPDLRIRRRLSGLTQPMSLAFGTGLVP